MPGTPTTRLSLPTIDGATDAVSSYPSVNDTQMTTLDAAALWQTGTLAARPTSGMIAGTVYRATDTGDVSVTDGSSWFALERQADRGAANGYAELDSSGHVPLTELSGITHSQLSASAAITGSQLSASAGILPSQIARFTPSVITASGSVTIPSGAQYAKVMMQGGGGGGAGSYNSGSIYNGGGGGGGGQYVSELISLSGVSGLTATIGSAGSGGSGGSNGNNGGSTTLAGTGLTTITAKGGAGGRSAAYFGGAYAAGQASPLNSPSFASAIASPGTGGCGGANVYGTGVKSYALDGGGGIGLGGAGGGGGGSLSALPGNGGGAAYGGAGGNGGADTGAVGTNATGYGNGGGGGGMALAGTQYAGGNGSAGVIIIEWM